MTTMAKRCVTCAYFYPCKSIKDWEDGKPAARGECRRNPPFAGNGTFGEFPTVADIDWCGEYVEGSFYERGFR